MMNCKQATKLISRGLDENLTFRERFALRLHLFMCKYCLRFSQQLKKLHVTMLNMRQSIEDNTDITLPSETRSRIAKSIESDIE